MNLTRATLFKLTTFIFTVMLSACITTSSPKAHFYTLATAGTKSQAAQYSTQLYAIEVLPVKMPERLKRPQLVINSKNSAELKILEQDRWASSFNDELHDAFVSGLSNQLPAIDVSHGGRVFNQPIYRIAIVLQQFNATPDEQVKARFGWTITQLKADVRENRMLSCQATIIKTVGSDIDSVVKGIQATVAETIQAITVNVNSLNNVEAGNCSG
jgi:uncharacterized lipoprotein YmbA